MMKSSAVIESLDVCSDYFADEMDGVVNNFSQLALFMKQKLERSEPEGTGSSHFQSCSFCNLVEHYASHRDRNPSKDTRCR